ncbi:hypothetical protein LJB90_02565 [Eubacteriales bacterium OttesenSCG-928-G02]|nr:hypothetical protein [Eubacteriales bacterium OttesenSCG-928-G02]
MIICLFACTNGETSSESKEQSSNNINSSSFGASENIESLEESNIESTFDESSEEEINPLEKYNITWQQETTNGIIYCLERYSWDNNVNENIREYAITDKNGVYFLEFGEYSYPSIWNDDLIHYVDKKSDNNIVLNIKDKEKNIIGKYSTVNYYGEFLAAKEFVRGNSYNDSIYTCVILDLKGNEITRDFQFKSCRDIYFSSEQKYDIYYLYCVEIDGADQLIKYDKKTKKLDFEPYILEEAITLYGKSFNKTASEFLYAFINEDLELLKTVTTENYYNYYVEKIDPEYVFTDDDIIKYRKYFPQKDTISEGNFLNSVSFFNYKKGGLTFVNGGYILEENPHNASLCQLTMILISDGEGGFRIDEFFNSEN